MKPFNSISTISSAKKLLTQYYLNSFSYLSCQYIHNSCLNAKFPFHSSCVHKLTNMKFSTNTNTNIHSTQKSSPPQTTAEFHSISHIFTEISPVNESILTVKSPKFGLNEVEKFLQGLTTQDFRTIREERVGFTAFLNNKGRFLCDSIVLVDIDNACFHLIIPTLLKETLMKHFQTLNLRKKVEIVDANEQFSQYVFVDVHHMNMNTLNNKSKFQVISNNISSEASVFKDPRSNKLGYRIIIPKASSHSILEVLNTQNLNNSSTLNNSLQYNGDETLYHSYRLIHGIPSSITGELQSEKSLPIESNLHKFNGISFNKGCYLGQETTARQHFVGVTRKRLYNVIIKRITTSNDTNSGNIPEKHKNTVKILDHFIISTLENNSLFPYSFLDTELSPAKLLSKSTTNSNTNNDNTTASSTILPIYFRSRNESIDYSTAKSVGSLFITSENHQNMISVLNVCMALLRDEHVDQQIKREQIFTVMINNTEYELQPYVSSLSGLED